MICTAHQVLYGWSNEEELDGQGIWHVWRGGEVHIGFWWENLREEDNLEEVSVDWKIILKWVLKKFVGSMNWIDLAQDRDRWWALLNAVMNLLFRQMWRISWTAEKLLASQEGICSIDLFSDLAYLKCYSISCLRGRLYSCTALQLYICRVTAAQRYSCRAVQLQLYVCTVTAVQLPLYRFTAVQRYSCASVELRLYSCTALQLYSCTAVQLQLYSVTAVHMHTYSCTALQLYNVTAVQLQLYSCRVTAAQHYSVTAVQRYSFAAVQLYS